ncbi:hypothetical protein CEXT_212891 [Caerostris extrusa]|uniref:Uncharacterized protein n=1 Tax=Caerostris extrusa TaxID=172846 RepID=A0AAV4UD96_CAEEX|nr:hypothetical protein CEXT_212891 [Caerostris extrusa]
MSTKCYNGCKRLCVAFSFGLTSITSNYSYNTSPSQEGRQLCSTIQIKETDKTGHSSDNSNDIRVTFAFSNPHLSTAEIKRIYAAYILRCMMSIHTICYWCKH